MSNGETVAFSTGEAILPSVIVGEPSVQLKYFDSHPDWSLNSKPYVTIIAVHGSGFNSSIWSQWLPYLRRDIRLLAYNRRGYSGSSGPYLPGKEVSGGGEVAGRYMLDLLGFVKFAVDELGVPPKQSAGRTGGIILLGWSRGAVIMIGLLSLLPLGPVDHERAFDLPADLCIYQPTLLSHLRAVLLYEPPGNAVGIPLTTVNSPAFKVPESERGKAFGNWLRATVPPEALPQLDAAWEEQPVAADLTMTLATQTCDAEAIACRALDPSRLSIGIGLIYGTATIDHCIAAANWIEPRLAGHSNAAVRVLQGAGHFAMVTHPQEFAKCVEDVIQTLDQ